MDYGMSDLAMYDDGMGAYITADMLKAQLMSGAAGAGGILVTSAIVQRIPWASLTDSPNTQRYLKFLASAAIGVLGGRMIWERSTHAAMGFVGGVVGSALAQLIEQMAVGTDATGATVHYLSTNLTGLSGASVNEMDLAALEAAVVRDDPAFRAGSMGGPIVTERALSAPGVTAEVLREYAPYLS